LSLWSYPSPFRDQGRVNGKGDGKELCDLLVVFERHIFIFSDKDCEFLESGSLEVDWSRWYRKVVLHSAEQVFGAERWIRQFPKNIYLDRRCTVPFPIGLPDLDTAIFHRIVVTHNGARKCREVLGGSGSLMLDNALEGNDHLARPFTIGQVNPAKGFVHVFDDTTLDVLMDHLDTITDFTSYLTKKEEFLSKKLHISAAGEEELLAVYLEKLNRVGEHDFLVPKKYNKVQIGEGFWGRFLNSPERRAQLKADEISYAWDDLIEKFLHHAMTGTQYIGGERPLHEQETIFRALAREPRTRRRMLARSIHEVIGRSVNSGSALDARVIVASRPDDPYYVFLCYRRPPNSSDDEYRQTRGQLLTAYCQVTKVDHKDATIIIGIATESGLGDDRSEDMIHLDASECSAEQEAYALELKERFRIMRKTRVTKGIEHEYPVDHRGKARGTVPSRNSKCKCRSGKRFRNCCGRKFYPKRNER
jgi:hypothetical protein